MQGVERPGDSGVAIAALKFAPSKACDDNPPMLFADCLEELSVDLLLLLLLLRMEHKARFISHKNNVEKRHATINWFWNLSGFVDAMFPSRIKKVYHLTKSKEYRRS